MYLKFLRIWLVGFGVLFASVSPLWAAGLPERLELALKDMEMRKADDLRLSFVRTTYRFGTKAEVKAFNPRRPVPARWDVRFPSILDNANKHNKLVEEYAKSDGNSDKELILGDLRTRMQNGADFLRKEENAEVFGFDIADEYILEGGGMRAEVSDKLKGEVVVDTRTNRIIRVRYYAPKPFHPISIVQMKSYEIVQHIAPAWEKGPLVRVYETSKAQGSLFIKRIKIDEVMINENFKPPHS